MQRYEQGCDELHTLALGQLNKPKNVCKEKFEDMLLKDLVLKLEEEIIELIYELLSKKHNIEKIKGETGDCAAVLAGVLAYINHNVKG